MERRAPPTSLGGEFDAFLFSSIGEDRNGMPLSVVSFLARRDLDPWLEAASLAELPAEAAARRLTRLIQTIAYQPLTLPDAGAIASRLVALLPRPSAENPRRLTPPEDATTAALASSKAIRVAIFIAIFFILMLGSQLVLSRHAPATRANAVDAPVTPNHPATDAPPPPAK